MIHLAGRAGETPHSRVFTWARPDSNERIRGTLNIMGGVRLWETFDQRNAVFSQLDRGLQGRGNFVSLRRDGDQIVVLYKSSQDVSGGVEERHSLDDLRAPVDGGEPPVDGEEPPEVWRVQEIALPAIRHSETNMLLAALFYLGWLLLSAFRWIYHAIKTGHSEREFVADLVGNKTAHPDAVIPQMQFVAAMLREQDPHDRASGLSTTQRVARSLEEAGPITREWRKQRADFGKSVVRFGGRPPSDAEVRSSVDVYIDGLVDRHVQPALVRGEPFILPIGQGIAEGYVQFFVVIGGTFEEPSVHLVHVDRLGEDGRTSSVIQMFLAPGRLRGFLKRLFVEDTALQPRKGITSAASVPDKIMSAVTEFKHPDRDVVTCRRVSPKRDPMKLFYELFHTVGVEWYDKGKFYSLIVKGLEDFYEEHSAGLSGSERLHMLEAIKTYTLRVKQELAAIDPHAAGEVCGLFEGLVVRRCMDAGGAAQRESEVRRNLNVPVTYFQGPFEQPVRISGPVRAAPVAGLQASTVVGREGVRVDHTDLERIAVLERSLAVGASSETMSQIAVEIRELLQIANRFLVGQEV